MKKASKIYTTLAALLLTTAIATDITNRVLDTADLTYTLDSVVDEDSKEGVLKFISDVNEHPYLFKRATILINSPGGSVADGNAIVEAMLTSDVPIDTQVTTQAASMAAVIFAAGDHRYMEFGSTLMLHEARVMVAGMTVLDDDFLAIAKAYKKAEIEIKYADELKSDEEKEAEEQSEDSDMALSIDIFSRALKSDLTDNQKQLLVTLFILGHSNEIVELSEYMADGLTLTNLEIGNFFYTRSGSHEAELKTLTNNNKDNTLTRDDARRLGLANE